MAIVRLAKNLTKTSSEVKDDEDYAELYSIATSKDVQGKGVGSDLIDSIEQVLKMKGSARVSLTTDYVDNDRTVSFYRKNGYEVLYEFVTYPSRKMYRLIKTL